MEARVAIVGATGFLGRRLVKALVAAGHAPENILALGRQPGCIVPGVPVVSHDLGTDDGLALVAAALRDARATHVVYLAALTNFNTSDETKAITRHINDTVPVRLFSLATELDAFFVYTSTDMVFDGDHAPYSPASEPRPITFYGETKRDAELHLLAAAATAGRADRLLIARLPLMYGVGQTFGEVMRASFAAGTAMSLFSDEFRTPALGSDVVAVLVYLLALDRPAVPATRAPRSGLVHVGGPHAASRVDMGTALARAMGLDPTALVKPALAADTVTTPRPRNICMISDETFAEVPPGLVPRGIEDGMRAALAEGPHPLLASSE